MLGECKGQKSPDGKHLEIITIERSEQSEIITREVGTCKYCGKVKSYKWLNWKEQHSRFNLGTNKKYDTILTWEEK